MFKKYFVSGSTVVKLSEFANFVKSFRYRVYLLCGGTKFYLNDSFNIPIITVELFKIRYAWLIVQN